MIIEAVRKNRMPGGRNGSAIYDLYKVFIQVQKIIKLFSVKKIKIKNFFINAKILKRHFSIN